MTTTRLIVLSCPDWRKASTKKIRKGRWKGYNQRENGKFAARIKTNNKLIYLGEFSTEEDAAQAYNFAAFEYHKEFAYYNRA